MANWYGAARSNYVKIKDMEGLAQALAPFPIDIHTAVGGEHEGKVCFLSDEQDSGGWPDYSLAEDDEEIEFDVPTMICPFMEDDQILVMMEAGHEKMRYVSGNAQAYNAKGEMCWVQLGDIYGKAADMFGVDRSAITAAEY